MLIRLKNKDTLIIDDFKLKCCIGKKGLKKDKIEGDKSTPKGIFTIGTIYYRKDKVDKPSTNLKIKIIKRNMGWCNDPNNKFYNKEIKINKSISAEKLYRKDYKYNYLIVINYKLKEFNKNKSLLDQQSKKLAETINSTRIRNKISFKIKKISEELSFFEKKRDGRSLLLIGSAGDTQPKDTTKNDINRRFEIQFMFR